MSTAPNNRILIVEDEPDVVDMLTLNLRKADGFTISTASDGALGLRKAREEIPSLIILDLMLPKMPGLEVCKVVKERCGHQAHSDHHVNGESGGDRSHRGLGIRRG